MILYGLWWVFVNDPRSTGVRWEPQLLLWDSQALVWGNQAVGLWLSCWPAQLLVTAVSVPNVPEHFTVCKTHVLGVSQGFPPDWGTDRYRLTATKNSGCNSCLNSWVQIAGVPRILWYCGVRTCSGSRSQVVVRSLRSAEALSILPPSSRAFSHVFNRGRKGGIPARPSQNELCAERTSLVTPAPSTSEKISAGKIQGWKEGLPGGWGSWKN